MLELISKQINFILKKCPGAQVAFFGDFNIHNKEWLTHSRCTDSHGHTTHDFAISYNLSQIVTSPTRVPDRDGDTGYLLDLFLTTVPECFSHKVTSPLGSSDHCVVTVKCKQLFMHTRFFFTEQYTDMPKQNGAAFTLSLVRFPKIWSSVMMFTSCLKALVDFLDSQRLLSDMQYGFRHSRSTGDLSYLTEHISRVLDGQGESRSVAMNISKAFASGFCIRVFFISCSLTASLVHSTNFSSPFLRMSVVLDGQKSSTKHINAGVPQGSHQHFS